MEMEVRQHRVLVSPDWDTHRNTPLSSAGPKAPLQVEDAMTLLTLLTFIK